jgi:aspartyl/asparaginyl beta-hydroxylase (cupin superfamily)
VFYDPASFAFTAALERHWQTIYQEYRTIREALIDWEERELYGEGWQVFALFQFPRGEPIAGNVARCPFTASLVREQFPRHGAAGYSVLRASTRIQPHQGYQGNFLRCHLGLNIPDGDCGLTVNGETRKWDTGKVLVFDDRLTHEAWNLTTEERVIFLADFVADQ